MRKTASTADFVNIVAHEISSGIDRALAYWLGRIELEVIDGSMAIDERIAAIEGILCEYKQSREPEELRVAS